MPTSKIDPMVYRLHARTPEYREREARLFALLRRELGPTCYVSFSAGKDSSVVADACHRVAPGIPMLMSDPGCPTHWTEEERSGWIATAKARGWSLTLFAWDKWQSRPSDAEDGAAYRRAVHATQFAELERWAGERGHSRRVMGLRGEESRIRRMSLGSDKGSSAKRLCPIGAWSTDDVWAYIVKHGLPWLSIYDHLGPDARNGLIGLNGSAHGRLAYLKLYYPEAYRMAREHFAADDLR
jgi:3'-phosphoadenosine 5'-phosphosulfate sulfotransferase (PAPS reductase)/FAD synthetase